MSRKLSMLEQVRESTRQKMQPQEMDLDGLLLHFLTSGLANPPPPEQRQFNPTQRAFIYDPAPAKAYMGSAGNGKSVTAMSVGMTTALTQPGSSGLVARQDYNDLMDTIVKDYETALEALPPGVLLERQKAPPMKWVIRPAVEGPPSTITFMGLKDTYKGGYKFDWAHVDEADEATEKAVTGLRARLGRGSLGHKLLMLTFNPPHKTHWLYTACTGRDATDRQVAEPWLKLFIPAPKENARNLPDNYYEDLHDLPPDQFMRLVLGQWGAVFDGEPVYREFKRALHVRPALPFDPYSTLLRFWDFGYRGPACLWAQQDIEGRLLILREECVRNIEIGPFCQRVLGITKAEFPGASRVVDYGDPAARQKKDTGSTLAVLNEYGITLHFIMSYVDDGLRAVRKLLQQLLGGEAALQIDERKCPTLIDGFLGGYRLDKSGMAPFKDGWYEHVCLAPETLIETPTGRRRLDSFRKGDDILSVGPSGPVHGKVVTAACTNPYAPRFKLTIQGQHLVGTGDHPILTQRGWVPLDALRYGDYVVVHEPNGPVQDVSAVRGKEVLHDREPVLLGARGLQQERVPASSGLDEASRTDSRDASRPSQEPRHFGQSSGESGLRSQVHARTESHDPGTPEAGRQERGEVRGPRREGMARDTGGQGLALGARQEDVEAQEALRKALHHLQEGLQDALPSKDQVLPPQLQDGRLSATTSWVREEVQEGPVYSLAVDPFHSYIADGVVVSNCDALRYGVVNLYGAITQDMERKKREQAKVQPVTPLAAQLQRMGLWLPESSPPDTSDLSYNPTADPMNWRP